MEKFGFLTLSKIFWVQQNLESEYLGYFYYYYFLRESETTRLLSPDTTLVYIIGKWATQLHYCQTYFVAISHFQIDEKSGPNSSLPPPPSKQSIPESSVYHNPEKPRESIGPFSDRERV